MRTGKYSFTKQALCVCHICALTFESLDLETSFLVHSYIFRICRSSSYIKVIGSRSQSCSGKKGRTSIAKRDCICHIRGRLAFDLKAIWLDELIDSAGIISVTQLKLSNS